MVSITIFTGSLPLDPDMLQLNSLYNLLFKIHLKVKVKVILFQAWCGPEGG